ncbi:MAG: hypothetical protein AAGE98_00495 [Actinomycetota bacterium]
MRTIRRVIGAALGVLLVALASGAGAQSSGFAQTAGDSSLIVVDARVTGDGPWTAWLGGPADRRLLLTVENTGLTKIIDPRLDLRHGRGTPSTPLPAPTFGVLEPGERRTVQVELQLDALSFGTHAVVGEFVGLDRPVTFRAETTHVPWLLLLLPTLVLAQVTLVGLRNRARRRLATTTDAVIDLRADSEPSTIELGLGDDEVRRVLEHELDAALAELRAGRPHELPGRLEARAAETTDRVARRLHLDVDERPALAAEITHALLTRLDAAEPVAG